MKWTYLIRDKVKTAVLFLVVAVMILGCSFLEKRYMAEMDQSVSSIYNDRLMPEASLLHINNHMFNRRLVLEGYLNAPAGKDRKEIKHKLSGYTLEVDSLIAGVELTYLVPEEARLLNSIKGKLRNYRNLELNEIDAVLEDRAENNYATELLPVFEQLNSDLLALSNIQTSVGKTLYQGARITKGSAWTIGHLQMAIVVLIALAVQALLFSSRSAVPKKFQKYNWN